MIDGKELYCYDDNDNNDTGILVYEDLSGGLVIGISLWHYYDITLPKEEAVKMAKAILDHYSEKDNA